MITDVLGITSSFAYGAGDFVATPTTGGMLDGALTDLIDGKGPTTICGHDVQGRMTREVRDNGAASEQPGRSKRTTSYTYEPVGGRLKTVTDSKGQIQTTAV